MSLLILSNLLDGLQAVDDNGDPLPFAVLTFWQSATVEPREVYADQELTTVLSDAAGQVVADASGVFPFIYLQTTGLYRVRLEDQDGQLRFDVDPYICDCKDPPYLFRNPIHQQMTPTATTPPTFAAPSIAGASIQFTDDGTDGPVEVYADAALKVGLRNPLPSDAAGKFPPVYLDDDVDYRVRVFDDAGGLLLDLHPYECVCGFELLTSRPYPLEDIAEFGQGLALPDGFLGQALITDVAEFRQTLALIAGFLNVVASYGAFTAPTESFGESLDITGGTLIVTAGFNSFTAPTESFGESLDITGGSLAVVAGYIDYTILPEGFGESLNITGGSLT